MAVAADDDGHAGRVRARSPRSPSGCSATARCSIERYFPRVRHVEVQILGLADGRVVALGERDCSVQRRNQKVAEETPSPAVDDPTCARGCWRGRGPGRRGRRLPQRRHGRVPARPGHRQTFFFLEMNTRLQVEHPITEAVYGIDLVEEQLRIAAGEAPGFDPATLTPHRARHRAADQRRGPEAVPARPRRDHRRGSSRPARASGSTPATPPGTTVTPNYDSLMAKLIVYGADRRAGARRGPRRRWPASDRRPEVQPAVLRRTAGQPGVRLRRLRHRHHRPDAGLTSPATKSSGAIEEPHPPSRR